MSKDHSSSRASRAASVASDLTASETPRKSEGWPRTPWVAVEGTPYVCPEADLGSIVAMTIGGSSSEQDRERVKHLIAAAPDLYEALSEAGGKDGFLLAQIATFIGGMADAYKLTGEVKATADWYWSVLHSVSEKQRAALSRARGEAQ